MPGKHHLAPGRPTVADLVAAYRPEPRPPRPPAPVDKRWTGQA